MFTLPGILTALALSFPALALLYSLVFKMELKGIYAPIPSGFTILMALIVGLLIPLISSLIPVYRMLN